MCFEDITYLMICHSLLTDAGNRLGRFNVSQIRTHSFLAGTPWTAGHTRQFLVLKLYLIAQISCLLIHRPSTGIPHTPRARIRLALSSPHRKHKYGRVLFEGFCILGFLRVLSRLGPHLRYGEPHLSPTNLPAGSRPCTWKPYWLLLGTYGECL